MSLLSEYQELINSSPEWSQIQQLANRWNVWLPIGGGVDGNAHFYMVGPNEVTSPPGLWVNQYSSSFWNYGGKSYNPGIAVMDYASKKWFGKSFDDLLAKAPTNESFSQAISPYDANLNQQTIQQVEQINAATESNLVPLTQTINTNSTNATENQGLSQTPGGTANTEEWLGFSGWELAAIAGAGILAIMFMFGGKE